MGFVSFTVIVNVVGEAFVRSWVGTNPEKKPPARG
jgi:hypothetical protein